MKPGVTYKPVASISEAAFCPVSMPTLATWPRTIATSARTAGAPVPSMTVPPRMMTS